MSNWYKLSAPERRRRALRERQGDILAFPTCCNESFTAWMRAGYLEPVGSRRRLAKPYNVDLLYRLTPDGKAALLGPEDAGRSPDDQFPAGHSPDRGGAIGPDAT